LGLKSLPSGDCPVDEKMPEGVEMAAGCVTPLAVIQKSFSLPIRDIAAFEQSGLPLDLSAAAAAAIDCARQEDSLVFNGSKALSLKGLLNAPGTNSTKLSLWEDVGAAVENIIAAVTSLDDKGFHGPYALGLAPNLYNLLYRRYPQGNQTELDHVKGIVSDGVVKAPAISSGGVLLAAGTAFASIVLGQDLMTGFVGPAGNSYEFIVSETLALWLAQPAAVCVLK
jgi:uncharacterized linocin/CFP29 family protein